MVVFCVKVNIPAHISWFGHDKHAIVMCRDRTKLKTDAFEVFV